MHTMHRTHSYTTEIVGAVLQLAILNIAWTLMFNAGPLFQCLCDDNERTLKPIQMFILHNTLAFMF